MNIGTMDSRIEIQIPSKLTNAIGEKTISFDTRATIWAAVQHIANSERNEANGVALRIVKKFRVRYFAWIDNEGRIIFQEKKYRIVGVQELGRKEGLEIEAEYLENAAHDD